MSMEMEVDQGSSKSAQQVILTVLAGVLTASILGLTVVLSGLREDMAVMKNDMQYLKEQASQSEISRIKMSDEINDLKMENQRLKRDHTEVNR